MTPPLPHIGRLIRRAQQEHNRYWGALVSEEVTSPQFAVLLAIESNPDADQRTIGRVASLDRSTVADVIDRMVRRGYLERRRDPDDQRRNLLRLSGEGRGILDDLLGRAQDMNRVMLDSLDPGEREELVRLLGKFVSGIAEPEPPAADVSISDLISTNN